MCGFDPVCFPKIVNKSGGDYFSFIYYLFLKKGGVLASLVSNNACMLDDLWSYPKDKQIFIVNY
jgi:hypothetical protein